MKLEISLFRFDKESDYLPYYTKHFFKITQEKNLLDILNHINNEKSFGYKNNGDFDLVVNGVFLKASISVEELTKNFGKELTIEPISIRRAYNDLLVDTKDFESRLTILKDLINEDDKIFYQTLKQYFYASNTLNYESEYIGDALLILASDLLEEKPEIKDLILKRLNEVEIGAQFHTSLKNRIYNFDNAVEEKIHKLQKELGIKESVENQNFRINNTLILNFGEFKNEYEVKHDFNDFNIAYYKTEQSNETQTLLDKLSAKKLNLESLKLDLAKETF